MSEQEKLNLSQAADFLGVSAAKVRCLIREGKIRAKKSGKTWEINTGEMFLQKDIFEYYIARGDRQLLPPTAITLKNYALYHDALDAISYLLNISYLTRDELKHKLIRNDLLLQHYLMRVSTKDAFIKKEGIKENKKDIIKSLKQAWYYELYFNSPARSFPLDCSVKGIQSDWNILQNRMSFIAPKIIMGYYAVYYYIRFLTLMFSGGKLNTQHQTVLNVFANSVMNRISNKVLLYPLNIFCKKGQHTVKTNKTLFPAEKHPSYCNRSYACWRRANKEYNISDAEQILLSSLHKTHNKNAAYNNKKVACNAFDLFQEFRVWANYIDVDALMAMHGEGYRAYLDISISKLVFILGGLCEYIFITYFGSSSYEKVISSYYDTFLTTNPILLKRGLNNPILQRNIILYNLGKAKRINENIIVRNFSHLYPIMAQSNQSYAYAVDGPETVGGDIQTLITKKKSSYSSSR